MFMTVNVHDHHPDPPGRSRRLTPWWIRTVLAVYVAIAMWLLFTGGPPPTPGGYGRLVSLTPTKTIMDAVTVGNSDARLFLVLNSVMLMPVGVFMALERLRPRTAAISIVLIAFLIEAAQYVIPGARSADIDDLLLNSAGGIAAFWITRPLLDRTQHKHHEGMQNG